MGIEREKGSEGSRNSGQGSESSDISLRYGKGFAAGKQPSEKGKGQRAEKASAAELDALLSAWRTDLEKQKEVPVSIYLSHERGAEKVRSSLVEFIAAEGGLIVGEDDPIIGSFRQNLRAWFVKSAESPGVEEVKKIAAHTALGHTTHSIDAQNTQAMMTPLGSLLLSLQGYQEAVVRVGALLAIKTPTQLMVHQLSPAQQLELTRKPEMMQSPKSVLRMLGIASDDKTSADALELPNVGRLKNAPLE